MKYTQHTTIEEYQAWLDTNPPMSEIRRVSRKVFQIINRALDRIESACKSACKRVKSWYKVITARQTETSYVVLIINRELQEEIDSIEAYNRQHRRIMEMLENEIAMEETLAEALEILTPAERP